jgi:predicted nucleotidyltransferase
MEMQLPDDFREFLKLLNSHKVEYLLIGGFAVGYYGYPRATNDIDVWGARTEVNATKLVAALDEFRFGKADLKPEIFLIPGKIVRMGVPPMRVEVLTGISGVEFGSCYAARIQVTLDGVEVQMISLNDLKINKRASF